MAGKQHKKNTSSSAVLPLAAALALALYLFHLLALFLPEARLWGINHLLFLPSIFSYLYGLAGIAALALLFPPIRRQAQAQFTAAAGFLFDSGSFFRWIAVSILALIVFWLLRLPVLFLGDGYNVVANIGNDIPVIVKWSETGATRVIQAVARLLPMTGIERGEYAFAVVSVVSGAATVFMFFLLAGRLAKDAAGKLFVFGLLIFSGWMLLFFGYAENYPILWPFITAYMYFGLRYLQEGKGLPAATVMLALAVGLHVQTAFFALSYPILLFASGRGAKVYRQYKKIIWTFVIAALAAGVYLFIGQYKQSLPFRLHFTPLFSGRPNTPDYFIFSPRHLLDMANLFSLLIPLWPALLVIGGRMLRNIFRDPLDRFLLLFSLGGLAFLAIIEPKLGLARDWDLFALAGLGPLLFLARRCAAVSKTTQLYPFMLFLSLVMAVPYIAANVGHKPALAYYEWVLDMDLPQSRPGRVFLRDHYYDLGDSTKGQAINKGIWRLFPEARMAREAQRLSRAGRFEEAMVLADSLYELNPYTIETLNSRGLVYMRAGYFKEAIQDLEMSAQLGRYDSRTMTNLGNAYYQTGQFDKMLECMRQGQKLNPNAIGILQGMAMGFFAMKQYDSALVYGQKLMDVDSTVPNGYLSLGLTFNAIGDYEKSTRYLTRYIELGPPGRDRELSSHLLEKMAADNK